MIPIKLLENLRIRVLNMSKKKNILNDKSLRRVAITFVYWVTPTNDYVKLATFLGSLKVACLVSPLHDKDINSIDPDSGEVKYKDPHYHVIIDIDSLKTIIQWFQLLSPIRNCISLAPWDRYDTSMIEFVEQMRNKDTLKAIGADPKICDVLKVWEEENSIKNMRGLVRYFKHLDNPEKHQYFDEDYHCFGGFDVTGVLLSKTDMISISLKIKDYIKDHRVYNFADLMDYCSANNIEWYQVLMNSQICNVIINYMKSCLYRDTGAQEFTIREYKEKGKKVKDSSL